MNIKGIVKIGDIISHPSWPGSEYPVVRLSSTSFYIDMSKNNGSPECGFPYYDEFFIVKPKEKKKSGFGKWVSKYG